MTWALANTQSEFTALARGGVFDGETGLAYHSARWIPEATSGLELLVVLVATPNHILVGFRVADGTLAFADQLWMDWSPLAIHTSVLEATSSYADLGHRDRVIAEFVLLHDAALRTLIAGGVKGQSE